MWFLNLFAVHKSEKYQYNAASLHFQDSTNTPVSTISLPFETSFHLKMLEKAPTALFWPVKEFRLYLDLMIFNAQ